MCIDPLIYNFDINISKQCQCIVLFSSAHCVTYGMVLWKLRMLIFKIGFSFQPKLLLVCWIFVVKSIKYLNSFKRVSKIYSLIRITIRIIIILLYKPIEYQRTRVLEIKILKLIRFSLKKKPFSIQKQIKNAHRKNSRRAKTTDIQNRAILPPSGRELARAFFVRLANMPGSQTSKSDVDRTT